LTEEDVKEFVASQVSDYKHLVEVEFLNTIPKLPSGKIQRKLLREKHAKDSQKK
jgi:4-coumarate--CoA ligase